jgi:DNA-binding SARP family transcriptional activator
MVKQRSFGFVADPRADCARAPKILEWRRQCCVQTSVNAASKLTILVAWAEFFPRMGRKMPVIELLGRPQYRGGNFGNLPKKAKGLLAYLAMSSGRAIPRERLVDLLWTNSAAEQGRHSLRQSLAAIRRAFGPDARDQIKTTGDDVLWAVSDVIDIDAHRFEILAQSAAPADLVAANELYRGEFLADFDIQSEAFMDWIRLERNRLEQMACEMLNRLATTLCNAGDHDGAIVAAQRLVAIDALREDGHRLLMHLYAQVGRRGEALRQFAAYRDHLRRELGVAPDDRTVALADAIRVGATAVGLARETHASLALDGNLITVTGDLNAAGTLALVHRAGGSERPAASEAVIDHTRQEAQPIRHPGERRQLTILACELTGLTAFQDVEDLLQANEVCYRRCANVIEHHHGYIARWAGDDLIAYFGYPQAREQDAENAVRAALALGPLAQQLSAELGTAVYSCTGIATGIAVVGDERRQKERTVLGDALTLSSRLGDLAKPGEIIIDRSTQRLLGRLYDYQELGCITLKGLATSVGIAKVLGKSSIESRFEAFHPVKLTPLVGRVEEIDLLLRRWQRAKDGEGSVALLVGEPGIGKSRLAETILESVSGESLAALRLFCSPHHQDSPLYPFINQLEREAGFHRGDTGAQRLAKLETMLQADADLGIAVPLLAQLFSVPTDDRYSQPTLTPQRRKEKILQLLAARMETLARSQPLLLIFEDAHWADPTSLELMDLIVERAPRFQLLVVITARPEFRPPWAGRLQTTPVVLGRLLPRQCRAIIAGVVHGECIPTSISKEIIDHADGIPLFVEELTKAVVESGALAAAHDHAAAASRPALQIPMTLHGSLLARLDRLGLGREVVQIGAALGRHFSYQLISAAAAIPQAGLDAALAELVKAELIWCRGSPPDAEYTFKHVLIQDAAYGTLTRAPRRTLHARIAETLATQFSDIADTQPELLAHHFTEAGLLKEAVVLWGKAGQLSLARSALKEAASQLERALKLIVNLQSTPALRQEEIKLQIALANAVMHTKGYAALETKAALDRARSLVEQAEALGEPPEDPLLLLSVLHGFWGANHVAFNGEAVRHLAVEFTAIAEKQSTIFPLVLASRVMGTSQLYLGEIAEGRAQLDRALSLYDPAEHRLLATRFGQEAGVAILSNRSLALWLLGYPEAALKDADDAVNQARDIGQTATFLYALTRIAWIHLVIGNYDVAQTQTRELLAVAADMEGSYWTAAGMMLQGCWFALTGSGKPAIDMIASGITASRLTGWNLLRMPWYLSCLAEAHVAVGRLDEAKHCICEAMKAMAETKESWSESDILRIAGDLELMSPEPNTGKAQVYYHRALALARKQRAKSWELRAAMGLARLWRDRTKRHEARDVLVPVYSWFTQGFDTPDLREAKRLIAELA